MRFKQIEDILDWVTQFHADLEVKYRELKVGAEKERVALLLDYLADHEHNLANAIMRYKDDASSRLLSTWFNQMPEVNYPERLAALSQHLSDGGTSEVVNMAIECHDLLIDMYKSLQVSNDTPSSKALFQSLIAMEEHEKMRMVRDAARLEGL